ncbi:MAG: substrate-binding domain-containing protein, partial [Pseudomonadota bacterium]
MLPVQAEGVTVFAAASLKTALDEVTQSTDVAVSYAASSTLARQIELGAPADIVILASAAWMDHLDEAGRLEPNSRHDLLGNELVLIASSDMMFIMQADRPVEDIIGESRVA